MFSRRGATIPLEKIVRCGGCTNNCDVNTRPFCKKRQEEDLKTKKEKK